MTDAHLLELGAAHAGRLATFDGRLLALGGDQSGRAELIPVGLD